MKSVVETKHAPAAIGPYSQAIDTARMVFCSGQIGLDPRNANLVPGGIEPEMRRALENLSEVLRAAQLGLSDVIKTTIFVVDLRDFDIVNRVYGEHFTAPYPARSTVQVAGLPRGARVEIEAIAMRPR